MAMTALVGACALRDDHWLAGLLEHRTVRHVGAVSYGIYLLNVPIVSACRRVFGEDSALLLFLVATAVSVGVATVAYRIIERPFLRLRER
jgi:peptidoglycan/LPS O-acetylase OafA/YrhL